MTNAVPALKLNGNSAKNLIMRYEVNTVRDDGLPQRSNKALFGQSAENRFTAFGNKGSLDNVLRSMRPPGFDNRMGRPGATQGYDNYHNSSLQNLNGGAFSVSEETGIGQMTSTYDPTYNIGMGRKAGYGNQTDDREQFKNAIDIDELNQLLGLENHD